MAWSPVPADHLFPLGRVCWLLMVLLSLWEGLGAAPAPRVKPSDPRADFDAVINLAKTLLSDTKHLFTHFVRTYSVYLLGSVPWYPALLPAPDQPHHPVHPGIPPPLLPQISPMEPSNPASRLPNAKPGCSTEPCRLTASPVPD